MIPLIKNVVLAMLCLCFSMLTAWAQVVTSTPNIPQNTSNQQSIQKKQEKLRKVEEKAKRLQQKTFNFQNITDSLQNITLFNKHRRDSLRWKNMYFGGDFGLSVGAKQIFVNVSPLVGFKLSDKFSLGGGFVFQYLRTQIVLIDPNQGVNIKQTAQTLIYGGRGFSRLFVHRRLFAQTDLELINVQLPTTDGSNFRNWVPGASAGAGYSFDIGRGMGLNVIASYNFLYKEGKSPYSSPLDVRFGIQF